MSPDLVRALGALAEPPSPELAPLAEALELGTLPSRAEHADLFTLNVYPYASVYVGNEGHLGGEARDRIAGFWRALGLDVPTEPDHVTSLLGLAAAVRERADQPDAQDIGDRNERAAQRLLLEQAATACLFEHVLPWSGTFLRAVHHHGSDFYGRWATTLSQVLQEMARDVEQGTSTRLPTHLVEAAPLEGARDVGGDAFLDQLTAPVRTGMVVTRADLVRLGRDLGLGARIGERKYMLRAYLGQEPQPALQWLAEHAASWIDRADEPLAAVGAFWSGRASRAVDVLREAAEDAAIWAVPEGATS